MATTVKKAPATRGAKKAAKKTIQAAAAKAPVKTVAKKAVAKKVATRTMPAKKAATKPVARQPAARKPVAEKAVAKKAVAKKPVAKKAPARQAAKPRAKGGITPAGALANTRRLLEAKHAHDRETPPWQALEGKHGTPPHAGFQDEQARDQANELHAGESRMEAIQGAIGTQDRHNQGKRDQR